MDVNSFESGFAGAPRSGLLRSRPPALAEACAQLTRSGDPHSVFSALDQALGVLYGPRAYLLWRVVPTKGMLRVNAVPPPAAETPESASGTPHGWLALSEWEALLDQDGSALLPDLPGLENAGEYGGGAIAATQADALGIAIRDLTGLAGAAVIHLAPAGPAREEDVAFGRILGECATAALIALDRVEREREAQALLERVEHERQQQRREIDRAEAQKKQFYRDILGAVTNGKLTLCDREEIDGYWGGPGVVQHVRTESDVRRVRQAVTEAGAAVGLQEDRLQDLCLCASEAATNALKHAGSGEAAVTVTASAVCVRVEDRGGGIDPFHLPRATLMKGYSTRASLGLGFTLMNELADRLYLTTSAAGTTVILEMGLQPVCELDQMLTRLSLAE